MKTITTIEITDEMRSVGMEQMICPEDSCFACERIVDRILTAALPIIEKQVREQCAAEIEAAIDEDAPGKVHNDPVIYMRDIGFQRGLKHAARIVQEGDHNDQ